MHTPVKTLNYRSEVPDSRRRSTSNDQVSFQSQSLLLVDLHYGRMEMSQMSIVPDRPDLSFRLVLGRRVLRTSATVSEKFVVLARFSSSPVSRHRDLLSFGTIGLFPMGHGSYYLVSSQPNQWLPIDEDGRKLFGKLDVSDDKKRGIVWGLPSSNKYWKGAWFFVSRDWGRSLPADREKSLSEAYVPRLFTQPGIFATGLLCLCFHCVLLRELNFHFCADSWNEGPKLTNQEAHRKENPVAADVNACDSEEEPLLRRSSAKGKGLVVEEEEGPPKSAGGNGVEVHVGAAGGSRGAVGLLEEVGMPWARSRVPDSRRRSTSNDQVSFQSQSLLLVNLHYGRMQMSFHEVLAVSGKPSLRPPFLWNHQIVSNGTRTQIFSSRAILAVGDDVAIYGEILHTTNLYIQ
ncbi:hypothetical protein ACOSP7_024396 [Xanthoceras sorbifolium]